MNLALLSKIMNCNASLIQLLLNQCRQLWLNLLDFRQYKYAGRQWRHQRFVFRSHDWHVLLKKKKMAGRVLREQNAVSESWLTCLSHLFPWTDYKYDHFCNWSCSNHINTSSLVRIGLRRSVNRARLSYDRTIYQNMLTARKSLVRGKLQQH